jgi:hypothetical protein
VRALFVVFGFLESVVPLLTVWRHDDLLGAVGEADPSPLDTHKGRNRAYTGAGVDQQLHLLAVAAEPDTRREGNLLSDRGELGV